MVCLRNKTTMRVPRVQEGKGVAKNQPPRPSRVKLKCQELAMHFIWECQAAVYFANITGKTLTEPSSSF